MTIVSSVEINLRNNFLQILHNKPSLKNFSKEEKARIIKKIMKNVNFIDENTPSYIFEKEPWTTDEENFVDLEDLANAVFKINETSVNESKIIKKQIELGIIVKPGIHVENFIVTRYGRSLLHEAIAIKDIELIKKYSKNKKLLSTIDNNNHTPFQMALMMRYEEAIEILKPLN